MPSIIVVTDAHCGSEGGLTPPSYFDRHPNKESREMAKERWTTFQSLLQPHRPFCGALIGGDMIDGDGRLSGYLGPIVPDRLEQVDMAEEVVNSLGATRHRFAAGTPSHVGKRENFEQVLAVRFGRECEDTVSLVMRGDLIDLRHKPERSSTLLRHRAAAAGRIADDLAQQVATGNRSRLPNIVLRGHAHYHAEAIRPAMHGDSRQPECRVVQLPCLQAFSSYGAKACGGAGIAWGVAILHYEKDERRGRVIVKTVPPQRRTLAQEDWSRT